MVRPWSSLDKGSHLACQITYLFNNKLGCFLIFLLNGEVIWQANDSPFSKELSGSVTRFGDLLNFGQVFKAFGNNYFAQISHILWQFL